MFLALLGSVFAFVFSTLLTQEQLLKQQIEAEAQDITEALTLRLNNVHTGARILAEDPEILAVINESGEAALQKLNSRAVVVRNRLNLDLVQIYDGENKPRTNLMLSALYRESMMLERIPIGDTAVVIPAGERLLLLRREPMAENGGTVIVGIDLATELGRIVTTHRLLSEVGLSLDEFGVATRNDFPFDVKEGHQRDVYVWRNSIALGTNQMRLILVRPITEIQRIASTGLIVMISSTLLTTLLLIVLSALTARAIAQPIQQLSRAAGTVAGGDLTAEVSLAGISNPLHMGRGDEIGLLARDFNRMIHELRDLYANLEAKVSARTSELALAAELARAVSSSLDPKEVLTQSALLIHRRLTFDHVLVFSVQPGANVLMLTEAADRAGKLLIEQGYRLPLAKHSMVGAAAATRQPQMTQDLTQSKLHRRVSLLPDTGSAAALPIAVQDTVLGVLYVHANQRHHFTQEQIDLLMALADQIAVGLHNARLYTQQRETAEHLAEVDRLKTEFLANMSHELRTPLNSIIGFSKLLLKELEGPINEAQAQELQIIHDSGQHLLSVINDVLDVSKINAGKLRLRLEKTDVATVAEAMIETIEGYLEDKPITLKLDIAPDILPIHADQRRVRQILLNLLSNAAKFTDEGTVTLRLRQTDAYDAQTQNLEPFVEISVIDTGIGIPEDRQDDIFEEFMQVDGSSTRRAGGTGLGLPLTKKLVELHGGRIWVESVPGKGSTFTVLLPLVTEIVEFAETGVNHA
jgi:signal transduction histidine kinase/HAMP domain-containing protein